MFMFRKSTHPAARRGRPARPATREGRRLFLENLEERSLLSAALPTTTTLATSASAVIPGQMVTLTAEVSLAYPNGGTPTDGSVIFKDGTTVLGTEPLVSGAASLSTNSLSAGTHLITAQYTGDVHNFAPSTNIIGPGSFIQTVAGGGQAGPTGTSPPGLQYGDGGPATAASLLSPGGAPAVSAIAVDSSGDIFIASRNAVREVNAQTGMISTVAGTWVPGYSGDGGPATAAALNGATGLAVDSAGDLFIADFGNDAVREVDLLTGIITTAAGGDTGINVGAPAALALDGSGNLFIASSYGSSINSYGLAVNFANAYSAYATVCELNLATGAVSAVAGNGISPWTSGQSNGGDGGQATAADLGLLGGLAVDNSGHLFIGDSYDCVVREVNLSTGIITTAAGDWEAGALGSVTSLAVDGQGHLFIGSMIDSGFTTPWGPFVSGAGTVQELNLGTGAITTLAGGAAIWQGPPNGPASAAYLSPAALSCDSSGDLFVENAYPCTVAEITPPAVVNVVPAVTPAVGSFGVSAEFNTPLDFTAAQFTANFNDPNPGAVLQAIEITRLPANGALALGGVPVTTGGVIDAANIASLVYTPYTNYTGSDSFGWNGSDGTYYAATPANVDITVTPPTTPATVAGFSVSVANNATIDFAPAQFTTSFSDPNPGAALQAVEITQLPINGTLTLGGTPVTVDQTITVASIANLVYTPNSGYVGSDIFGWNGSDGTYYAAAAANVSVTVLPSVTSASIIASYDPSTSTFFLHNSNTAGVADETLNFGWTPAAGGPALVPLSGDWTGSGAATVGLYDPATSTFFLSTSDTAGPAQITFDYGWVPTAGKPALVPLVGDWTGQVSSAGHPIDTIGLYDPSTGNFFLRNSDQPGPADQTFQFGWGNGGLVPLVGDWTGQGHNTVGLYNPASGTFFLDNTNTAGTANETFQYGPSGLPAGSQWTPIAGDWTGSGSTTIGLFNPATSTFFLRNSNTAGYADQTIQYGAPGAGWVPVVGDWAGAAAQPAIAPALGTLPLATAVLPSNLLPATYSPLGATALLPSDLLPATNGVVSPQGLIAADTTAQVAAPGSSAVDAPLALDPASVDQVDLGSLAGQQLGSIAGLDELAAGVEG